MLRILAAFIPALALLPSLGLANQRPDPAGDLRTVSTTGTATVYVTPDEVVVRVEVATFGESLDEARAANDEASAKLVKAVRGFGVEGKHLQTANLDIDIQYREFNKPNSGVEGYTARRAYSLTLKDVKRFEALVETVLKNGANRLNGFEYRSSEMRKHRDEARKLAIRAAKEKAAALAGELDCTLGTPRTITEGAFGDDGFFSSNSSFGQNAAQHVGGDDDGAGDGGGTMPLGQIAIQATISTTFDLVPAAQQAAAEAAPAPAAVP